MRVSLLSYSYLAVRTWPRTSTSSKEDRGATADLKPGQKNTLFFAIELLILIISLGVLFSVVTYQVLFSKTNSRLSNGSLFLP